MSASNKRSFFLKEIKKRTKQSVNVALSPPPSPTRLGHFGLWGMEGRGRDERHPPSVAVLAQAILAHAILAHAILAYEQSWPEPRGGCQIPPDLDASSAPSRCNFHRCMFCFVCFFCFIFYTTLRLNNSCKLLRSTATNFTLINENH